MRKSNLLSGSVIAFACIALMLFTGCGYSIHRQADLPFTEIRIGSIVNRTLEPKLQDKLHRALVEEFSRNGIAVSKHAANSLSGVINRFEMTSLSEKQDITVEYRITVEADFTFTDSNGKTRPIQKATSPFILFFGAARDMSSMLASRDLAEEKAAADIAMEIVGALIYK